MGGRTDDLHAKALNSHLLSAKESDLPYRRETAGSMWHWCRNGYGWSEVGFQQREDKPPTWGG